MDKSILCQYMDACELVKETELEIAKIKRQRETILRDSVKGSMHDFPFTERRIHIQGLPDRVVRKSEWLENRERLLIYHQYISLNIFGYMNNQVLYPQKEHLLKAIIIRFRVFEGLKWSEVAIRMGRGTTEDGIKKEFQRFTKEK